MLPGALVVGDDDATVVEKKEVMLASTRGFLTAEVRSAAFRFRDIVWFGVFFFRRGSWMASENQLRKIQILSLGDFGSK